MQTTLFRRAAALALTLALAVTAALSGFAAYEMPIQTVNENESVYLFNLDTGKPILVLDHQPRELEELAAAGVDVDLCGHTHDGQMFPGNLTVRLFWENACGCLRVGSMHSIVTSGVGLFGPNMRVATRAEICPITIHFMN